MAGSLGDLYIRLGFANEDEFIAALKRLAQEGERTFSLSGQRAGASWTEALKSSVVGGVVGGVFATALIQAEEAVRRFVGGSVDEFARMERAMAVASMSGVENVQALRQEITALAREAGLVAESDVAVAVAELTKAGLSAADAVAVLRSGLALAVADMDAATGSIANAAQTATTLNGVLRSFGLSAADAGRASDILAAAAAASAASLGDMIAATSDIAPLAAQAGLGLNELAATIATLTNQNIPAAEAARGLRSILASLIDPPAQVREQFQALGLTILKADGTIRPFSEVLQNLKRVADSGGAGLKLLSQGMDQFALATALAIGRASGDIRSLSNELANSEGAAKRMADAMRQTLSAQMEEARARTRDAARELGQSFAPILVHLYSNVFPPVIQGLRNLTQALAEAAGVASKGDRLLAQAQATYGKYANPERAKAILTELDRITAQIEAKEAALKGFSAFALANDPILKRKQEEVEELRKRAAALRQELIALQRAGAQAPPSPQPKQAAPTPTATPLPTLPATGKREEDAVVKAANRLGQEVDILRSRFERGAISQAQYEQGLARIRNELAALEKQVGGNVERAAAVEAVYQALGQTSRKAGTALDALQDRLKALDIRYKLGKVTLEEYAGGLAKLEKEAKTSLNGPELDAFTLSIRRAQVDVEGALLEAKVAPYVEAQQTLLQNRAFETAMARRMAEEGRQAAEQFWEAYADQTAGLWSGGRAEQATIDAIRRSYSSFQEAVSAGADIDLAARAFSTDFVEGVDRALAAAFSASAPGYADVGAMISAGLLEGANGSWARFRQGVERQAAEAARIAEEAARNQMRIISEVMAEAEKAGQIDIGAGLKDLLQGPLYSVLTAVQTGALDATEGIYALYDAAEDARRTLTALYEAGEITAEEFQRGSQSLALYEGAIGDLRMQVLQSIGPIVELGNAVAEMGTGDFAPELTAAMSRLDEFRSYLDAIAEIEDPVERLRQLADLEGWLASAMPGLEELIRALEESGIDADIVHEVLQNLVQRMRELKDESKRVQLDQEAQRWADGLRSATNAVQGLHAGVMGIADAFSAPTFGQGIAKFASGIGSLVSLLPGGQLIGPLIGAVGGLVGWLWDGIASVFDSGWERAQAKIREATTDWQLVDPALAQRAVEQYTESYLFGIIQTTKYRVNEEVLQQIREAARTAENAVQGGLQAALNAAARGEDWREAMRQSLYQVALQGVTQALMQSEAIRAALGPLTTALAEAILSGNAEAIAAASQALAQGFEQLGPIFEAFGQALAGLLPKPEEVDELARRLDEATQSWTGSARNALAAALDAAARGEDWQQALNRSIYSATLDAVVQALMQSEAIRGALSPLVDAVAQAVLSGDTQAITDASTRLAEGMRGLGPIIGAIAESLRQFLPTPEEVDEFAQALQSALEQVAGATKQTLSAALDAAARGEDWREALRQSLYSTTLNAVVNALMQSEAIKAALGPLTTALAEAILSGNTEAIAAATAALAQGMEALAPLFESLGQALGELLPRQLSEAEKSIQDLTSTLEDGVAGAVKSALQAGLRGEDWQAELSSRIREGILSAVVDAAVTQAVVQGSLGPLIDGMVEAILTSNWQAVSTLTGMIATQTEVLVGGLLQGMRPLVSVFADLSQSATRASESLERVAGSATNLPSWYRLEEVRGQATRTVVINVQGSIYGVDDLRRVLEQANAVGVYANTGGWR